MNAKDSSPVRALAEKIIEKGQEISDEGGSSRRMINWLESLLSKALEAAYSKGVTIAALAYKESVACQLAKEEAYEQSAQIADGTGCKFCICDSAIASQIRQKAGEIKK